MKRPTDSEVVIGLNNAIGMLADYAHYSPVELSDHHRLVRELKTLMKGLGAKRFVNE